MKEASLEDGNESSDEDSDVKMGDSSSSSGFGSTTLSMKDGNLFYIFVKMPSISTYKGQQEHKLDMR